MRTQDWPEFWWNSITGPNKMVTAAANGLMSLSKVVLRVPADLPWRHQMRVAVEDQVHMMTGVSDMVIHMIDARDEWDRRQDPGTFLLQRFGTSAAARGFRPRGGTTIQSYMIANGVLRNTILWVKGLDAAWAAPWLRFCRDYRGASAADGLFLLEVSGDAPLREIRGLQVIELGDNVRMYDVQLFNSFILDEMDAYTGPWKRYAAELAANLCGIDAQVSWHFLRCADLRGEDPLSALERVAELPELSRRGEGSHVLSLSRRGDAAELERRIWSAQLQVFFPFIELERRQLIQELHDELTECLQREMVEQFGHVLTLPEDVEFGTLDFLMSRRADGTAPLPIRDGPLRERVHLLRDCRNVLAHGCRCSHEQVAALLDQPCAADLSRAYLEEERGERGWQP